MKITILNDYQYVIENLQNFELLKGQRIEILHETELDPDKLASLIQILKSWFYKRAY